MIAGTTSLNTDIAEKLASIGKIFNENFDNSRFSSLIQDSCFDCEKMQDLRHAIHIKSPTIWDLPIIHRGLDALSEYLSLIQSSVLPRAKNMVNFGMSSYNNKESAEDKFRRKIFFYVLPFNLKILKESLKELKGILPANNEYIRANIHYSHYTSLARIR